MNKEELTDLLNNLNDDMDEQLETFFNNSILKEYFKELINLTIFDNKSLDDKIINKLDELTDNMDEYNFKNAKINIEELQKLLNKE